MLKIVRQQAVFVPEGRMKIAHRFNGGEWSDRYLISPVGTIEVLNVAISHPYGTLKNTPPTVETVGYSQSSLWDEILSLMRMV